MLPCPFLKTNNNDLFHLPFVYTPPQSYISQLNYCQYRNKKGHLNSQGTNYIHHLSSDCNSSICKCAPHIFLCVSSQSRDPACSTWLLIMFIIWIKILTILDVFLLFCRASFRNENFTSAKIFLPSSLG